MPKEWMNEWCWPTCVPLPLNDQHEFQRGSSYDAGMQDPRPRGSHFTASTRGLYIRYGGTSIRDFRFFTRQLNCILPLCCADDQTSVTGRPGRIFITWDFGIYCSLSIVTAVTMSWIYSLHGIEKEKYTEFQSGMPVLESKVQGDKKSLCALWLQCRKYLAQSDCLAADRQGQGDTRLTLTPSVIPNSNYVIMVNDWKGLKYFCMFFVL
jgi:hypothetical protein